MDVLARGIELAARRINVDSHNDGFRSVEVASPETQRRALIDADLENAQGFAAVWTEDRPKITLAAFAHRLSVPRYPRNSDLLPREIKLSKVAPNGDT